MDGGGRMLSAVRSSAVCVCAVLASCRPRGVSMFNNSFCQGEKANAEAGMKSTAEGGLSGWEITKRKMPTHRSFRKPSIQPPEISIPQSVPLLTTSLQSWQTSHTMIVDRP